MKALTLFLLLINNVYSQNIITSREYDYPLINNLQATFGVASMAPVAGTSWWDIKFSPTDRYLNGQRTYIDIRFYKPHATCDEKSNSLVFVLTGVTGKASNGLANQFAYDFIKQCHHVLILPSIFNADFVTSISTTGVIGNSHYDIKDFYHLMQKSISYINKHQDLKFDRFSLMGYSLGALTSAFIHKLDKEIGSFKFNKTLLINPPVNIDYSLSKVDNFKKNLSKIGKFKKIRLLSRIGKQVAIHKRVKTNRVAFLNFIHATRMTTNQYKAMIGMDLSKELTSIILSSKEVLRSLHGRDLGIIPNYSRRVQRHLADKIGFEEYLFKFVMGYRTDFDRLPPIEYNDFIALNSLVYLTDWLKTNEDIFVMHNIDDFIISKSDITYMKNTFGDRLTLYPRGGHMGNIWHKDNKTLVNSILGSNKTSLEEILQ